MSLFPSSTLAVVFQDAKTSDVRRAYRKLSMTMHPDKNKTEGAEENFRILVAINEVCRSGITITTKAKPNG